MPPEPAVKRTVAFIDGQNLFHAVREAFGYTYPNYDVLALTRVICEQDRWLKIACAYPLSPTSRNRRGINKTDWLPIERETYDACLDTRDYRPAKDMQ